MIFVKAAQTIVLFSVEYFAMETTVIKRKKSEIKKIAATQSAGQCSFHSCLQMQSLFIYLELSSLHSPPSNIYVYLHRWPQIFIYERKYI